MEPTVSNSSSVKQSTEILKATHQGKLKIGHLEIPCYVLENGKSVLSFSGLMRTFGSSATNQFGAKKLPHFLASKRMFSFITNDLIVQINSRLEFIPIRGGKHAFGYDAMILPIICETILDAHNAGKLKADLKIVQTTKILYKSLARIGIVALVHEATGFQSIREHDALQKIFDKYLQSYARTWQKTFRPKFFEKLFELYSIKLNKNGKHPLFIGRLINNIVYDRPAPHITDKLKELNPTQENNLRKHKHHQFLTEKDGLQELKEHLIKVETLMCASKNREQFESFLNDLIPKPKGVLLS